jgi:hypothetical protein
VKAGKIESESERKNERERESKIASLPNIK